MLTYQKFLAANVILSTNVSMNARNIITAIQSHMQTTYWLNLKKIDRKKEDIWDIEHI